MVQGLIHEIKALYTAAGQVNYHVFASKSETLNLKP